MSTSPLAAEPEYCEFPHGTNCVQASEIRDIVIKRWADWLQQIQFPFDNEFREGNLPRYLLRPLAEVWREKDDSGPSIEEWETMILLESPNSWEPETA